MVWTPEKIQQIPQVYRDFMMVLRPVVETRDAILRISAIPWGMILAQLGEKYDYSSEQVRRLANNLGSQDLVAEDAFGFFVPTPKGEELIRALSRTEETLNDTVPSLPAM